MHDGVLGRRVGVGDGTFYLVDAFREVPDRAQHLGQVDRQDIVDGLSHVERFEQGELIAMRFDALGKTYQHVHARTRCEAAPAPVAPGRQGVGNRCVDIGRVTQRDLRDHPSVGRADAVKGLAAGSGHEPTVDEMPASDGQAGGCSDPISVRAHKRPLSAVWVACRRGAARRPRPATPSGSLARATPGRTPVRSCAPPRATVRCRRTGRAPG